MKRLLILLLAAVMLGACGSKDVDIKDMYSVDKEEDANQGTKNIDLITNETYDEAKLKKIIIDASSNFNHDVVNGIRFNILDKDGKGYAEVLIAFNEIGMNATGAKKKNITEINMK